jgi:hypothetical protein
VSRPAFIPQPVPVSLLYLSLGVYGAAVASGVAQEKTTRVAEVLLATVRPSHLLAGKVVGIGRLRRGPTRDRRPAGPPPSWPCGARRARDAEHAEHGHRCLRRLALAPGLVQGVASLSHGGRDAGGTRGAGAEGVATGTHPPVRRGLYRPRDLADEYSIIVYSTPL